MPIQFSVETPKPNPAAGRLMLIVALVFGVLGTGAGVNWLRTGSIEIRGGQVRSGPARSLRTPPAASDAPVAGAIRSSHLLFYPLCLTWMGLGLSMIALSTWSIFSSTVLYHRLSAYSCLVFFLLAFGTVAAALWSGP
jgi:hypothetical protein